MRATIIAGAILLTGCAAPQPPTNPNPAANFAADRWACQQAVASMPAPAAPAPAPAQQPSTLVTNCQRDLMGGAQCTTQAVAPRRTATDAMFETMAKLSAADAQHNHEMAWRNCMMAKGWR